MFILQIEVESYQEAEQILATLKKHAPRRASSPKARRRTDVPAVNTPPRSSQPDGVRKAMQALQARRGISNVDIPLGLFRQFGVENIRQLKPEQHADFIAACVEA